MVKVLSGGEQAKVRLCKLINTETNVLLLDEPTNHLDVDAKEELKRALQAYKGQYPAHLPRTGILSGCGDRGMELRGLDNNPAINKEIMEEKK